ncbi:MAG: DEAD/DEAH box helicase family protein [Patescibacteria group bacterium]
MIVNISEEQLHLYQSLFRGRTDVYARRWEKNERSGYSPAYQFDWNTFLAHKTRGGTMATFEQKTALPLTPDVIKKHLLGQCIVGIYPLLENNTSYFIAADFDGERALEGAKKLIETCAEFKLPGYLERSRSGQGTHVWLFFEDAYLAVRSRSIMLECIRRALQFFDFDKEVAFDRLFPNQDMQSGKGFGNLIALPLQGVSLEQGNTLFLDPVTTIPYPDQWAFLAKVKRIPSATLDASLTQLTNNVVSKTSTGTTSPRGKITLRLDSGIHIMKSTLDKETVNFLREELNFPNLDYWLKKRLGKSVYQTEKFFRLIEEEDEDVILPRGFLSELTDHFRTRGIPFVIQDQRPSLPELEFSSVIKLRPTQSEVIDRVMEVEQGVIVAPAGSGKTIMGLELIARRKQPALILTHRKQIMDQWIERAQTFLGIAKAHVGRIDGLKKTIGEKVTVAMMQSLVRQDDLKDFQDRFGTIIVDECHHIPAKTFREVISHLDARFCYGLTATPKRKHNDEKLIYLFIGGIIAELTEEPTTPDNTNSHNNLKPERIVHIHITALEIPFSFTTDDYQLLARIVSFDQSRNQLILDDIRHLVAAGKKTLVLSERKEHLEVLNMYLKGSSETIIVTGDDSVASRKNKFVQIVSGHYRVIFATGQLLGEGLDLPDIQAIVLAFPLAFEGKLTQYIGRIRGAQKIVYDYHDAKTPFLDHQFKKRKKFYERSGFTLAGSYTSSARARRKSS